MRLLSLIFLLSFSIAAEAAFVKCPSITLEMFQLSETIRSDQFQAKNTRSTLAPDSIITALQAKFSNVVRSEGEEFKDGEIYVTGRSQCEANPNQDSRFCESTISILSFDGEQNLFNVLYEQSQATRGAVSFYLDETKLPNFCEKRFQKASSYIEIDISKNYEYMPFNTFISWTQNFSQDRIDSEIKNIDALIRKYLDEDTNACVVQDTVLDVEQKYIVNLKCENDMQLSGKYEIDPRISLGGTLSFFIKP